MIIPGQRSLPVSVHNRFDITFTTRFSTSIGCVGSRLRARHRTRTTVVRVFAFLTSVDIRLLESDISHCVGRRGSRGSSCNSCPGSTLLRYHVWGCFCTVLLCCLITWATHSHPCRAPVYCGCQPGPTGVLIHPGRAVDQQCANPLAAALMLHCTELDTCVRVRPY